MDDTIKQMYIWHKRINCFRISFPINKQENRVLIFADFPDTNMGFISNQVKQGPGC